ncbi:hypothetical protein IAT38_007303 [Cryptococcus sp. DSM 104549]
MFTAKLLSLFKKTDIASTGHTQLPQFVLDTTAHDEICQTWALRGGNPLLTRRESEPPSGLLGRFSSNSWYFTEFKVPGHGVLTRLALCRAFIAGSNLLRFLQRVDAYILMTSADIAPETAQKVVDVKRQPNFLDLSSSPAALVNTRNINHLDSLTTLFASAANHLNRLASLGVDQDVWALWMQAGVVEYVGLPRGFPIARGECEPREGSASGWVGAARSPGHRARPSQEKKIKRVAVPELTDEEKELMTEKDWKRLEEAASAGATRLSQ